MRQPVAHEQRDAADACWNFDDDDNDRPAETLQLLPGAYPGTVRFTMSRLGTSQVIRVRLHGGGTKSGSRRKSSIGCWFGQQTSAGLVGR